MYYIFIILTLKSYPNHTFLKYKFQTTPTAFACRKKSTAKSSSPLTLATNTIAANSPRTSANPSAKWTKWTLFVSRRSWKNRSQHAVADREAAMQRTVIAVWPMLRVDRSSRRRRLRRQRKVTVESVEMLVMVPEELAMEVDIITVVEATSSHNSWNAVRLAIHCWTCTNNVSVVFVYAINIFVGFHRFFYNGFSLHHNSQLFTRNSSFIRSDHQLSKVRHSSIGRNIYVTLSQRDNDDDDVDDVDDDCCGIAAQI